MKIAEFLREFETTLVADCDATIKLSVGDISYPAVRLEINDPATGCPRSYCPITYLAFRLHPDQRQCEISEMYEAGDRLGLSATESLAISLASDLGFAMPGSLGIRLFTVVMRAIRARLKQIN